MLEPATLLVGTLVTSLLALVVLIKNYKSITNQLFMILSSALVGWSVTTYLSLHTTSDMETLYWIRWIMFFVVVQNTSFFFLVRVFPATHFNLFTKKIYLGILFYSAVTSVVSVSPLLFTGFVRGAPIPGPGIFLFILHALLFVGAGILLIVRYRRAKGLLKTQLGFFLTGTILMFTFLPIGNFLVPVIFKYNKLVFLSPLYAIVFTGFIAYAIVKHRLLDISLLIARAVSYALFVVFVAVSLAVILYLPGRIWLGLYFSPREEAGIVTFTVIIALIFQFLRKRAESVSDRIFYKNKYDSTKVLYDLALIMASTLRLEDLTHEALATLLAEVSITKAGVLLLFENHIIDVKTEGFTSVPVFDEEEVRIIAETPSILLFDDLEEGPMKDILRRLDIAAVVHLRTEGKQIGLLLLGLKKSGDMYSPGDVNLLDILAPEFAVAIQNAQAYEEIRRFNITLQEEVHRATEDLQKANIRLKELDTLKDEFVSLASHELRTPLAAIRSYIWMAISGKGGEISQKQKYYLDRAFTSSERLIKLVNGMLNISRIESGRMAIQLARVDIVLLIHTTLEDIQPKLAERKLTVGVSVSENVPHVIADADKIQEVLINFLGNAVKFTPVGGRIRINIATEDGFVRVAVTDTGVGIAPTDVSRLFTKFGAVRSGATPDAIAAQSTGLGLYISKSIISMHGGQVRAFSAGLGKGSTFSFTLPTYSDEGLQKLQLQYKKDGLGIIHSTID